MSTAQHSGGRNHSKTMKNTNSRHLFVKSFLRYLLWICIPTVVVGTLALVLAVRLIHRYAQSLSQQPLQQVAQYVQQMENYCSTMEDVVSQDSYNGGSLQTILEDDTLTYVEAVRLSIFSAGVNALVNNDPSVDSAYIYWPNRDGRFFASNRGILLPYMLADTDWANLCPEDFARMPQKTWYAPRILVQRADITLPVLTVYRKIFTLDYQTSRGVIAVNFDMDKIHEFLAGQTLISGQKLLLLDADRGILAGNVSQDEADALWQDTLSKADLTQTTIFQLGSYTILASPIQDTPLLTVSCIPNQELYVVPHRLMAIVAVLVISAFALALALAARYSAVTAAEIQHILDLFEAAQNGESLPACPEIRDERSYIMNRMITTFVQQEYLRLQLSEKTYKARSLELVALQAQINPHFLFNTMETIKFRALALTGGPNGVTELMENLSGILYYTLQDPERLVPLSEELAYAHAYLNIQSVRFRNTFSVDWQYDSETTDFMLPKLVLQPIIENSIRHGIRPAKHPCVLKIHICYASPQILQIEISDDGVGMDSEQVCKLQDSLLESEIRNEHIGLGNTYKRLVLLYGEDVKISIRSELGVGTTIGLLIPAKDGIASS